MFFSKQHNLFLLFYSSYLSKKHSAAESYDKCLFGLKIDVFSFPHFFLILSLSREKKHTEAKDFISNGVFLFVILSGFSSRLFSVKRALSSKLLLARLWISVETMDICGYLLLNARTLLRFPETMH